MTRPCGRGSKKRSGARATPWTPPPTGEGYRVPRRQRAIRRGGARPGIVGRPGAQGARALARAHAATACRSWSSPRARARLSACHRRGSGSTPPKSSPPSDARPPLPRSVCSDRIRAFRRFPALAGRARGHARAARQPARQRLQVGPIESAAHHRGLLLLTSVEDDGVASVWTKRPPAMGLGLRSCTISCNPTAGGSTSSARRAEGKRAPAVALLRAAVIGGSLRITAVPPRAAAPPPTPGPPRA